MISIPNAGHLHAEAGENEAGSNIQLILGSYRSGKTDLLLDAVLKHCRDQVPAEAIIVVPSERYRSLLEKRILKLSKKNREHERDGAGTVSGIFGLRLLTFYQYCRLLLNYAGVCPRILPDAIRPRIVQMLLQTLTENTKAKQVLPSLAKLAANPGASQAILDLIDELQRAALSPKEVIARLERTAGRGTAQLDYAFLYDQYWQTLDRIDYLDEHRLAYKILELSSNAKLTNTPLVVAFDGFDRFHPLQLQVIATSARLVDQIVISFDYLPVESDPNSEYEWKRKTYEQLATILQPRERLIPSKKTVQKKVQVFSSADRYLEMYQIAALAKEAIVKREVSCDEILVVIPRIAEYAEAAEAAFHDAGIDCFLDAPIRLTALPIIRFLTMLFSLKEEDFARAELISCLKNPHFKLQELALTPHDVTQVEAISYKQKVIAGEKQWMTALESEPLDLKSKLQKLFRVFDQLPQSGTAYTFVAWIEDLIDLLVQLSDEETEAHPLQLWQLRAAVSQIRGCLASMLAEEDVLESLGQSSEHKYKVHLEKLKSLIGKSNFPKSPTGKECVLICTGETAPNRSYDEVYIAGLVEGEFPTRSMRGGLLTNDEVLTWQSHGIDLHNPRFEPGFAIALLTGLTERARKRIVMSTPQFNMDGEELTPAFFFTEQIDSGKASRLETDYFPSQRILPVSPRAALAASLWCRDEEHANFIQQSKHPLISELKDNLAEAQLVARLRDKSDLQSPYNGCLKEQTGTGMLKIQMPEFFSASQLGTYGSCPHKYWLSHALKAKVLEEPEEGLDNKDRGSAYHKALELFYGKLIADNKAITDLNEIELDALASSSIDDCLLIMEREPTFRGGEFWHYQKLELAFRFKQFVRAEYESANKSNEQFKPLAVEASFGYNEQVPPLKISVQEGSVHQKSVLIRGRIDRIDEAIDTTSIGNRKLRIIDYKTGHSPISQNAQKLGIDLQLPIYALAAERSVFKGSKVVKGQYLSVHACKPIGSLFPKTKDGDPEENPLDNCEAKVREFVQKIDQGYFMVAPASGAECTFCEHKSICRVGELTQGTNNNDETD